MNTDFCIISNDCWGAEIYIERKIAYNTPFVGLFIPPSHFVKMANNLQAYLATELVFVKETAFQDYKELYKKEQYPIALLGDVEIHFLHYTDETQARSKWNRRLNRMPKDTSTWFIKGCDREVSDWNQLQASWNSIPFNKIFFSAKKRKKLAHAVTITESYDEYVTDGKALYNLSKDYFEIDQWIDSKGNSWELKTLPFLRNLNFQFKKLKYKINKL
ncbi:DUF1919 domain-containing protein [Flavobacterium faecale]|uniref:DUF1919 domain-containing protein n=1 Tax=Flavobacterium faecale TaxID=1355330 RepID=UPI003AB0BF74